MKTIKNIVMSAVFVVLGTAAVFADVIPPGNNGKNTPIRQQSSNQGGMIMLAIIVVAAVIILLVWLATRKRGKAGEEASAAPAPLQAAAAAVGAAAKAEEAVSNAEAREEVFSTGEMMQIDAENADNGPEIMAAAPEVAAVDAGSAAPGGEAGGEAG